MADGDVSAERDGDGEALDADADGDGEGDGLVLADADADGDGEAEVSAADGVLDSGPVGAALVEGSGTLALTSSGSAPSREGDS